MKVKSCAECGTEFVASDHGHMRKYCGDQCRDTSHRRRKAQREGTYTGIKFPPRSENGGCIECGGSLEGRAKSARYCSDKCRRPTKAAREKDRYAASKPLIACANPYCHTLFSVPNRSVYCSSECSYVARQIVREGKAAGQAAAISRGMLEACRIYYFKCCDCGSPIVRKWKRPGKFPCCRLCARRRYLEHMARKNHKRRTSGKPVMSVFQLAKRDGEHCNICHRKVDMTLSGNAKWGPTIDHLIPVSDHGTNDPENLALAHRHCNVSRNSRGPAQLLLIA